MLQKKPTSLVTVSDQDQRKILISDYLDKFALIAGRGMTPTLYAIYEEALADIPLSRLQAGLREWMENGVGWPWPGQIREASEL